MFNDYVEKWSSEVFEGLFLLLVKISFPEQSPG